MQRLDQHADQAGAWDVLSAARGHIAFDIGANIGQSTKVLAQHFDLVVALEPCEESFRILQAEAPDNVVCIPAAATATDGELTLTVSEASIATGQLTTGQSLDWGESIGERTVQGITVDSLTQRFGAPDFVKIDTEGHEVEVLKGWTRPGCPLIVEVHRRDNEDLVRGLIPFPLSKLTHADYVHEEARVNHFWLHGRPDGM